MTRAPQIQAVPARKRLGQPDLPVASFVARCSGRQSSSHSSSATTRARAIGRDGCGSALAVAVERDAVKLHPMIDEAEAELLGDPPLQRFKLLVDELDDLAGLDID